MLTPQTGLCAAAVQWLHKGEVCLQSSFSSNSYQTVYKIVKLREVFSYLENIAAFSLFFGGRGVGGEAKLKY